MSTVHEANDTNLAPRPLVTRPELDRATWFGSNFITALATSEETGGRYALLRLQNQRSYAPPPHRHGPEAFYVVGGVLRFDIEGQEIVLTEGSFLEVPPGAWHTFAVESEEAEFLILAAPGWGIDQFFRQAGRPAEASERPAGRVGPPDLATLQSVGSQFQMEFAPPGSSPKELAQRS
jgi:quercetin dioxygenase-like cupin family protein